MGIRLKRKWKTIEGFSTYEVSNDGRVRSYRKKLRGWKPEDGLKDEPLDMQFSDDGNGYLKVMLIGDDGKRYCRKVHRLVAEAFLEYPEDMDDPTVDHISSDKLDNSVDNLMWVPRSLNVSKSYYDGLHEHRIRLRQNPVVLTNIYTKKELYFDSVGEAAGFLGRNASTISHAASHDGIAGCKYNHNKYTVERPSREEILFYGYNEDYQVDRAYDCLYN